MTSREFFYLAAAVRDAQRTYLKTRHPIDFRRCRALENEIDREISRVKKIIQENDAAAILSGSIS